MVLELGSNGASFAALPPTISIPLAITVGEVKQETEHHFVPL